MLTLSDLELIELINSVNRAQPVGILCKVLVDDLMYHKRHRELFDYLPAALTKSFKSLEAFHFQNLSEELQEIADNLINPNYRNIGKVDYFTAFIGCQYSGSVNNQRAREGIENYFDPEELWGGQGEHLSNNIVRHNGQNRLYLCYLPRQNLEGKVLTSEPKWFKFDTHEPLTYDEVKNYLPKRKEGSKRQQTDKRVAWRTVAIENIEAIKMRGEVYQLDKLVLG